MSVTSCHLLELSADEDDKGVRRYKGVYRAVTNSRTDGPASVLLGSQSASPNPIPRRWAVYNVTGELDIGSYCRKRSVSLESASASRKVWSISCEWDTPEPGQEPDRDEDPLARPTQYRVESETFTVLVDEDKDNAPIVNAAGKKFDEPIEEESTRLVLVAQRNLSSLDQIIAQMVTYQGRVNSATYRGEAARRWLCRSIVASDIQEQNSVQFYSVTYRLALRENGLKWNKRILNQGFAHYDQPASDPNRKVIDATDDHQQKVSEPILLAADGTRLADGVVGNFLEFEIRPEANFQNLGI